MWTYHQLSGLFLLNDAEIGYGWSGYEDAINIPAMQNIKGIGCIPRGIWLFEGPPFDHPTAGPYTLRVTPAVDTQLFGRGGFLLHGRWVSKPFDSSEGCLVADIEIREKVWTSGVRPLQVVV